MPALFERLASYRLPLLAGGNWRERLSGASGALFGVAMAGLLSTWLVAGPHAAMLLLAPIGASAVLVFVVPSSPLAQPWPVIGGTIVSTASGVVAAQWLGHGALGAGVAVALAILGMSATRCLHPAGGGCALLAVVGGPAVLAKGYSFALMPAGLNAVMLVLAGIAFHRISGHRYPHRAAPVPPQQQRLLAEDIDAVLEARGEAFDISRDDLLALLDDAERHAEARRKRR